MFLDMGEITANLYANVSEQREEKCDGPREETGTE